MDLIPETDKIDMAYLKSDKIGKVICKGLAELYKAKPQFPVEYFANWLLNYCKTDTNKSQLDHHLQVKEDLIHQQQEQQKLNEETLYYVGLESQRLQEIETDFKQQIKSHLFHQKFLVSQFCDFLVEKNLTGVYVGLVDFPSKNIAEGDDDENAHLDQEQPKLIKYIGANKNHESIMLNKTLALDQGVTGEVFKEIIPSDDPNVPTPSSVVYVPQVTKEPRMVYFQWPKLGAFLAIPLIYNSCLLPGSLDAGIEERLRFKKAFIDKQAEKEADIVKFNERIKEATDAEQDPEPIQQELQQYLADYKDAEEAPFLSQKRQLVVCFDTLGQDKEISPEQRQYFEDYVNLFAAEWQNTENRLLSHDIDLMIQYYEQGSPKERSEQLNIQEDQQVDAGQGQFDELKEKEKEYQFEIQSLRLTVIASQIGSLKQDFLMLKEFRILKFAGILQALLLFLGYDKQDICESGTNQLDWNATKFYVNDELFNKIREYSHRGARPEQIKPYAKLNRIRNRLQKFTVESVEEYNVCYSKLLKYVVIIFRWLVLAVKLRTMDCEIRRDKIKKLRSEIEQAQAEAQKIQEDKETKLEEHKASLQPEDLEIFNKEEWELKYDEEHPLPKIPQNVEDDIDFDYDEE